MNEIEIREGSEIRRVIVDETAYGAVCEKQCFFAFIAQKVLHILTHSINRKLSCFFFMTTEKKTTILKGISLPSLRMKKRLRDRFASKLYLHRVIWNFWESSAELRVLIVI